MLNSLEVINPLAYPGWDDLLLTHPNYSIFHTYAWAKVLAETYGYKPKYFFATRNGTLSTLVPVMEVNSYLTGKRGVSLPFSDYCDLAFNDQNSFKDVTELLTQHGRTVGWRSIEFRCRESMTGEIAPKASYFHHILDLKEDEGHIFKGFRGSTQRNIRKAEKENVKVSISTSIESIRDFYRLHCMTRKKHGVPPQPFSFFINLHKNILEKNKGFIVFAMCNGSCISAAVYLHFGKRAYYKYGASDSKAQHLRASNLVMWEAIRWYLRNGYQTFCFGRTDLENKGLRQFKNGWGTRESFLYYYKYDLRGETYVNTHRPIPELIKKVFTIMPIPLSRIIGSLSYRYIG